MARKLDRPLLYKTAEAYLRALDSHDSLFVEGKQIWTPSNLSELDTRIYGNPDERQGPSFTEKLKGQLRGADTATIQLAAEMLFVFHLKDRETDGSDKLERINEVLAAAPDPPRFPPALRPVLDYGIARFGMGKLHKWPQYEFLLRFSQAWQAEDAEVRATLRSDPWVFRGFVESNSVGGALFQEEALLHLVHPETFEPIISRRHKKQIVSTFGSLVDGDTRDLDRALLQIRKHFEADPAYGPDVNFYGSAVRTQWDVKTKPTPRAAKKIDVVLRWQPRFDTNTVLHHREIAERDGTVWWGKIGKPTQTALSTTNLERLEAQIGASTPTFVYLYGDATAVRTRLHHVQVDPPSPGDNRVPDYYGNEQHHLWFLLSHFEDIDPGWLTSNLELAQSRTHKPLTFSGQSSLILVTERQPEGESVEESSDAYFILASRPGHGEEEYGDELGAAYGFDADVPGHKALVDAGEGQFVLYHTAAATDGTGQSFVGSGVISGIIADDADSDDKARWTARLTEYVPFSTPVARSDFSPAGWSYQHPIARISREHFEEIRRRGEVQAALALTPEGLQSKAESEGLVLPSDVYTSLVAALNAGKHVILTGPPGTAKTTLAGLIAESATELGATNGYLPTTATADWTTFDTVGGLRPAGGGQLRFVPGHFLEALKQRRWLVIDELNRSNFDRAFGQFFTVLSGQSVVLPFTDEETGAPIALVPDDVDAPTGTAVVRVPKTWRIVATMNVFDKSLLFEMSYALMRRFAFVEVGAPPDETYEDLIRGVLTSAPSDLSDEDRERVEQVLGALLKLRNVRELGPAVFKDMCRFAIHLLEIDDVDDNDLAFRLFFSYLLPQFEGVTENEGRQLLSTLAPLVGSRKNRLRGVMREVLGLDLGKAAEVADDVASEEDADEGL